MYARSLYSIYIYRHIYTYFECIHVLVCIDLQGKDQMTYLDINVMGVINGEIMCFEEIRTPISSMLSSVLSQQQIGSLGMQLLASEFSADNYTHALGIVNLVTLRITITLHLQTGQVQQPYSA